MGALSNMISAFDTYYTEWSRKAGTNPRLASIKEEKLKKMYGLSHLFVFAGTDANYSDALTYYHSILSLLNVSVDDIAWDVTTADLEGMFAAGTGGGDGQYQTYTDGSGVCRCGVRDGIWVVDKELTPTGFDGTENVDWENILKAE